MRHIKLLLVVFFILSIYKVDGQLINSSKSVIELVVTDNAGNPVQGARIHENEGTNTVKTNGNGMFTVSGSANSLVLIEAEGFESKVVLLDSINDKIILSKSKYLMDKKDIINVAFDKVYHADLLGDISVINTSKYRDYDNTINIPEAISGRVPGLLGGNIRGLGNALVILDGIPRYQSLYDINLNLKEIEQITVLKDVNSVALYGVQARNGVIIITTKRGNAYKRDINVSVQSGLAKPIALPKYLNSADYMELYNEARVNDGLSPLYDQNTINNYRSGNKYRYPDIDYYSPEYVKSFNNYSNVITDFSGGNDFATYYVNLGWLRSGSLINFGEGKKSGNNRFNALGNIDFKISKAIKNSLGIAGIFDFNRTPLGNYFSDASTLHPNAISPYIPIDLIRTDISRLQDIVDSRKNDIDGKYMLGGTQQLQTNPFADIYIGGSNQMVRRTMHFNDAIDFSLESLLQGLSLKTIISLDFNNSYNQSIRNSYSIYQPNWSATNDSIIQLTQYGTDSRPGTQVVSSPDFWRRTGIYGLLDYKRTFNQVHNFNNSLLVFYNSVKLNGTLQPNKNMHAGLRLNYNYAHTYYIDFSSALTSSNQLPAKTRIAFSPTLSLGWTVSNEDFLTDAKNINFLKLKASAGIIHSDQDLQGFYYYENVYAREGGNFTWADGAWNNYGVISLRGTNPKLGYEKRNEINLGLEGTFFDNALTVNANAFITRISNIYTQPIANYPSFYTDFLPWENSEENGYKGFELGLEYSKKINDFKFDVGVNAMYLRTKVVKRQEVYSEAYQYRKGNPVDSYYGLVAEGLFQDQNDIDNHAFQTFGVVKPGDIKYKDQNNDKVIDSNDEVKIGQWLPPFSYGTSLRVSYKNISLFAIGTGQAGSQSFMSGTYYIPEGDAKYSHLATQRWTESTKSTAKYPRLSSLASTNNNRSSTFWMYSENIFSLNRVQITYEFSDKINKALSAEKLSIFMSGSNLGSLAKNKEIRNLNIGAEPQYRYFTVGLHCLF